MTTHSDPHEVMFIAPGGDEASLSIDDDGRLSVWVYEHASHIDDTKSAEICIAPEDAPDFLVAVQAWIDQLGGKG